MLKRLAKAPALRVGNSAKRLDRLGSGLDVELNVAACPPPPHRLWRGGFGLRYWLAATESCGPCCLLDLLAGWMIARRARWRRPCLRIEILKLSAEAEIRAWPVHAFTAFPCSSVCAARSFAST